MLVIIKFIPDSKPEDAYTKYINHEQKKVNWARYYLIPVAKMHKIDNTKKLMMILILHAETESTLALNEHNAYLVAFSCQP